MNNIHDKINKLPSVDWLEPKNKLGSIPSTSSSLTAQGFKDVFMTKRQPVVIKGLVKDWPAITKWNQEFFKKKFGSKTVTVKSLDKLHTARFSEKEKLDISFYEFIEAVSEMPPKKRYYLALGNITAGTIDRRFEQSPFEDLKSDFTIPLVDPSWSYKEVNLWMGYHGVKSHLHFDCQHNFLSLVSGYKKVALYEPNQTSYLYPRSVFHPYPIFSKADPMCKEDQKKFKNLAKASYMDCILEPGDTLYIPPGYWHYVCSLSFNVAVNAWFMPHASTIKGEVLDIWRRPLNRTFLWRSKNISKALFKYLKQLGCLK